MTHNQLMTRPADYPAVFVAAAASPLRPTERRRPPLSARGSLAEHAAGDQQLHHLVGALQDLVHTDVAQVLLHAVVLQVAVAAEQLQGGVDYLRNAGGDRSQLTRTTRELIIGQCS